MPKPRKKKRARATATGQRSTAPYHAPFGVDLGLYVGAPTSYSRRGRPRVEASCGHPVWVDPSWKRAKREGKRLICLDCVQAIAEEHGALLIVYQREAA